MGPGLFVFVRALIMSRAGQSQRQIADYLGITHQQVANDVNDDITCHLTEELLREAIIGLPESVDADSDLGIDPATAMRDVNDDFLHHLTGIIAVWAGSVSMKKPSPSNYSGEPSRTASRRRWAPPRN